MDKAYKSFVDIIITEMDKKLTVIMWWSRTCKVFLKPYWSDDLQTAWNINAKAEKDSLCENGLYKKNLKATYCDLRKYYDRQLKSLRAKRQYQCSQMQELEHFFMIQMISHHFGKRLEKLIYLMKEGHL